jgi:hypothetical protein
MLVAHLALSGSSWPIELAGTAFAGAVAYVPSLVLLGLTPMEKATVRSVLRRRATAR